jgi:hypothetical protein
MFRVEHVEIECVSRHARQPKAKLPVKVFLLESQWMRVAACAPNVRCSRFRFSGERTRRAAQARGDALRSDTNFTAGMDRQS